MSFDTPDYQRGIASPQQLLASPSSTASTTVTLPANTETLMVIAPGSSLTTGVTAAGVTTSVQYPGLPANAVATVTASPAWFFNVTNTLDTQITVTFASAPSGTWYVIADARAHPFPIAGGCESNAPVLPVIATTLVGQDVASTEFNHDTTGATVLFMAFSMRDGTPTPTDTYSNTWVQIPSATVNNEYCYIYYTLSPNTGSGHTIGSSSGGDSISVCGLALSGTSGMTLDSHVSNAYTPPSSTTGVMVQPGALTPGGSGFDLFVANVSVNNANSVPTIAAPFSLVNSAAYHGGGGGEALCFGWYVANGAQNPVFTFNTNSFGVSAVATMGSFALP